MQRHRGRREVREDDVELSVAHYLIECVLTIGREKKVHLSIPDLSPEFLTNEQLEIRLVVNDQDSNRSFVVYLTHRDGGAGIA